MPSVATFINYIQRRSVVGCETDIPVIISIVELLHPLTHLRSVLRHFSLIRHNCTVVCVSVLWRNINLLIDWLIIYISIITITKAKNFWIQQNSKHTHTHQLAQIIIQQYCITGLYVILKFIIKRVNRNKQ